MKKIQLLYILFLLVAFSSCKNEYVEPTSFSDVSWYSLTYTNAALDRDPRIPVLGKGNYFSIMDISQGAKSHEWKLMNDSIFFLGGEIVRNDSTLSEKIIGGGKLGDISQEKTVHLYFPTAGIQTVKLRNTFDDEVTFIAEDTTLRSTFDAATGLHVFEHEFKVDVYHDVVAAYKVYRENGDEIDFSLADTIEINLEPREKLSFVQVVDSIYHITDVTWTIPNGVPTTSSADSAVVTFYSPGVIKGIKLKANRSGKDIPTSSETVILPLKVTVNDGPFKLVDLTKVDNKSVKIQLSGVVAGSISNTDFSVVAHNVSSSTDFPIDVASIVVSDDGTSAIINLDGTIYSDDEVEVTYTGTTLESADGRPMESGSLSIAPITDLSVLDEEFYSFNKGTDTWSDVSPADGGIFGFPEDPSGGVGNSIMLSVNNASTAFIDGPANIQLEQGVKYKITYKLFIHTKDGLNNGFALRLLPEGGAFDDPNGLNSGWNAYGNTNHFKAGEWVTHSYEKVAQVSGNYFINFRIGKGGTDDYGTFYADDLNVEVVDSRP